MAADALEEILQTIGLSDVVQAFKRERITPDLIPKLTREDFKQLGVLNLQKMMKFFEF